MKPVHQNIQGRKSGSALQPAEFIDINRTNVSVNHDDNGKPHSHFRRSHSHDEENKNLSRRILAVGGESNEEQVHRVKHEFNAHKNNDGIAANEDAHHANAKEYCRKVNEVYERNRLKNVWHVLLMILKRDEKYVLR